MSPTDVLKRGLKVLDTGEPITVPVGKNTLGRIFNVLSEVVYGGPTLRYSKDLSIHRSVPPFIDLDTSLSIFETGIKVVDLLAP